MAKTVSRSHRDPGQARQRIQDPRVLRALAHPARLAIIEHLGAVGSATATQCAQVCGLSPSATSYHLRELAKAGLIKDAPGRGDARERVWQPVSGGMVITTDEQNAEQTAASRELLAAILAWGDAAAHAYLAGSADQPPPWNLAGIFAYSVVFVTAQELDELGDRIDELLVPYRRAAGAADRDQVRAVSVQVRAFPVDTVSAGLNSGRLDRGAGGERDQDQGRSSD